MPRDDEDAPSRSKGAADVAVRPRRTRRRRQWTVRETIATPRSSFEELEIRTRSGAVLRALVDDPPEGTTLRATLVLAHAMFARKSSFGRRDRPGLSSVLTARGFRTVAFDFRGHGDSVAPEDARGWGYDDLVREDVPAIVEYARARGEDKPVIVVGHSLGGHVALAALGTGRTSVDAVVALGVSVWLRELERSHVRWGAKRVVARAMLAISSRAGGLPARKLRIGSDDASERYVRDLLSTVTTGSWASADGADDYLAALARVRVPVAAVLGERDRLNCHPSAGEAFVRRCAGPVAFFRAPAGHMELVTGTRAHRAVIDAVEWALAQACP
jgi:pimeloyl-ACP methyl ester carboxylesterase